MSLCLLKFQVILGKTAPEAFGIFLGYQSVEERRLSVLVFVCVFFCCCCCFASSPGAFEACVVCDRGMKALRCFLACQLRAEGKHQSSVWEAGEMAVGKACARRPQISRHTKMLSVAMCSPWCWGGEPWNYLVSQSYQVVRPRCRKTCPEKR